jgi:DNA repair ATPase RecN
MTDIADTVSEAVEEALEEQESKDSRFNSIIALLVAITATFMALSGVKAGNLGQAMAEEQALMVNSWSYFQSKSTKQNLAEATLTQLQVQRALGAATMTPEMLAGLDKQIAKYEANVKRYEVEKNEIKAQAEGHQAAYARLNNHDDQFDLSDAALSVAIALFGITALTRKRPLLWFAILFMIGGLAFGIAGFMKWDFHPETLTSLFS